VTRGKSYGKTKRGATDNAKTKIYNQVDERLIVKTLVLPSGEATTVIWNQVTKWIAKHAIKKS